MTTQNLKRVAYVALETSQIDRMSAFYQDLVGLEVVERDGEGRVYLRCDAFHHAVVLVPGAGCGMDHYGLDLGDEGTLEALAGRLEDCGVEAREVEALRGHGAALEIQEPNGNRVRLAGGTETAASPTAVRATVPRKFGHMNNMTSGDLRAVRDFYVDVLDFRVSDWFADQLVWLRCNPDHHGVACGRSVRDGMQHFALEAKGLGDLLQQADHLARNGRRLLWGPGRHGPGNNLFIYFHDPDENIVELTAEVEQIWDDKNREEPWHPSERPEWANLWGPPPTPGFTANIRPAKDS